MHCPINISILHIYLIILRLNTVCFLLSSFLVFHLFIPWINFLLFIFPYLCYLPFVSLSHVSPPDDSAGIPVVQNIFLKIKLYIFRCREWNCRAAGGTWGCVRSWGWAGHIHGEEIWLEISEGGDRVDKEIADIPVEGDDPVEEDENFALLSEAKQANTTLNVRSSA
jgi:hypothetical protein